MNRVKRIEREPHVYPLLFSVPEPVRAEARNLNRLVAVDERAAVDGNAATARKALLPASEAVSELPTITLSPSDAERLRHGQRLAYPGTLPQDDEVVVVDRAGTLIAIATVDRERRMLVPDKVFG